MKKVADIHPDVLKKVRQGTVIPAQVLALDENRRFAPRYQRALTRYFIDAGAGGIAVGVHSTQFAIRKPEVGLFEPVLRETSRFIDEWCEKTGKRSSRWGASADARLRRSPRRNSSVPAASTQAFFPSPP